ncbi:putative sulfurtransferase [Desulfitispora alkaliphila]|uniref:rhodanese-like domain-containing protein n=1 Tax=Desulfitispora alkaliphila TaxID=622674 RepID=UPI003D1CC04C
MRSRTRKLFLIILIIITIAIAGCASVSYQNLSADEAKDLINNNPQLQVIDVREQWEYDSGHISGSVLIPLGKLDGRIDELDSEKPPRQ